MVLDEVFLRAVAEQVPEFFRDEGRDRVQEQEELAEDEVLHGETIIDQRGVAQSGFRGFDVPVAEVAPEERIETLRVGGELMFVEVLGRAVGEFGETLQDREVIVVELRGLDAADHGGERRVIRHRAGHLAEAGGVPELVAEVAALADAIFVEEDILALRGDGQQAEAEAVGAELGDEVERLGRVAEGLRHLAAELVADDAVEVDALERDALADLVVGQRLLLRTMELEAGDDHAGDPEEDDVRSRGEGAGRIPVFELFGGLARLAPADGREAPEPGRGPRVEHVVVLFPVRGIGRGREGHVQVFRIVAVGALAIPDRDAVAPPELAADAPILDVLEPVEVGLRPAFRVELDDARSDGALGFVDLRVADEPLFAETRFDRHIGAFGVAHGVLVGLGLHQGAEFLEQLLGHRAGLETFDAGERTRVSVHRTVGIHHVDDREVVALADIEVGAVVGRGDLQHARAEILLDGRVADDRDLGAREGAPDVLADKVLVALVVGVDRHGGVAGDGFRTRGRDFEESAGEFGDLVTHAVERALGGLHDHLFVGEARLRDRAPVHHALAAVDIAAFVERDEGLQDRLRVAGVECVDRAVPVAGGAELAELSEDDAAVLVAPFGGDLDELLAAEVVACLAFLLTEFLFDAGLRGDAGVVGAREPEGGLTFLTGAADHDVLQRVIEQVSHVQDAGDVGRRDHHRERFAGMVDLALEATGGHPAVVPLLLDALGFVRFGDFSHRKEE